MTEVENQQLRYCLYARKSTESDERQAMSIDSQIKEMMEQANSESLNIVEVRQESHSAKLSGARPVFKQLIADIDRGLFNAILTWAPDRLSRNAGDLGALVDLMDRKQLLHIKTYSQTFSNNPNEKFLLMILCSQAKLENDHRGENVKRGIRAKCERGWRPCMSPLGYLNRTYNGEIDLVLDPVKAPIIKEMFELVAYCGFSGRSLKRYLDREKNFKSRRGVKLNLSRIYAILKTPFYCGEFEYPEGSGNWYKGKHEALIDKELFNKVQEKLATADKPNSKKHDFPFTRQIRCGTCGSHLTGEERAKQLKNGDRVRYVYYHCLRGKDTDYDCKEPYIREDDLITQLVEVINEIEIDKEQFNKILQEEYLRFAKFKAILDENTVDITEKNKLKDIDVRTFAKHILKFGSNQERREIFTLIKQPLFLKNMKLYINKPKN
jgi:DNA invertase Pin-like site-specific DNA recombinase